MKRSQLDTSFASSYNDICHYIASSAFNKIMIELQDEEWDEEDMWLSEIFNMMIRINDGDGEKIVAHKALNEFLQNGFDIDIQDLLKLDSVIRSSCKQELLAVQITRMAFESGTVPEVTYAKIKEILS